MLGLSWATFALLGSVLNLKRLNEGFFLYVYGFIWPATPMKVFFFF